MIREEQQKAELEFLIGSKYEVLCRIGGGGMAQVFLARHRQHGGLFAIKVLADHLAHDTSIVARFKQEATTAASLSGHPNIVSIFDIGEGNGLHYLIMPFMCGEDMANYQSREGKLSPPAAAGVITQTAEALAWAESKRVVHRDLKPANMHLDTAGRIKILDFGISKITDVADGLTRPGESLGTPFYMSPEQIRGEGCDVRSDLYSLGVVFFELLTGRRPFENESATAVQMAHLSSPPPSLLEFEPGLPPMCEQIVQKLLRKDRSDRYQSAQELLDELHANGASSGPTSLRPTIEAGLQAEIDRAPRSSTGVQTSVCSPSPTTPAPQITDDRTAFFTQKSPFKHTIPPISVTSPVPPIQGSKRSRLLHLVGGAAATLLLAIAGLTYALHRRTGTAAPAKATAAMAEEVPSGMVLVPSGDFIFGENDPASPRPRESIRLSAFYIDRTEVSNKEYGRFVQATGRTFANAAYGSTHPDEPVTQVSAQDAAAYAAWAGKRLPTEQEWEKAARGTDGRPFPWGSEPWTQDVPDHLQPVVSFEDRKSPYGVLNMAGNVWEWTSTAFPAGKLEIGDMRRSLKTDVFSQSWLSLKGGCFSPTGNPGFRVYLRRGFPEDQHSPWIGFRCAKDASGT